MPSQPEGLIAFLIIAGPLLCILGVVFLAFAALFIGLLVWGARQWQGLGTVIKKAKPLSIAELAPGLGLVRVSGTIARVDQPLNPEGGVPLAMLRMQIYGLKSGTEGREWGPVKGKTLATPFWLDDGTGTIWVDPHPVDPRLMGNGVEPTDEQVNEAYQILGIDPFLVARIATNMRYQLWEWRVGQRLTVIGPVVQKEGRLSIGRVRGQPMLVSPLDVDSMDVTVKKTSSKIWIVIGVIVALLICCPTAAILPRVLAFLIKALGSLPH
ncbi:MAG: E3 ubiquitin ligase family protein [Anaerolineae bacterium]|jgi:hypothetical protein|nr:E3 ubiquitin ligase family protein [Anaerolineae bacterium]MDH7475576.1 GIDE domain-containing protein [Anaerolineae bacterium]